MNIVFCPCKDLWATGPMHDKLELMSLPLLCKGKRALKSDTVTCQEITKIPR